jgi:hypothetical protein
VIGLPPEFSTGAAIFNHQLLLRRQHCDSADAEAQPVNAVNSESHTEPINTISVMKVELFRMLRMEVHVVSTVLETIN